MNSINIHLVLNKFSRPRCLNMTLGGRHPLIFERNNYCEPWFWLWTSDRKARARELCMFANKSEQAVPYCWSFAVIAPDKRSLPRGQHYCHRRACVTCWPTVKCPHLPSFKNTGKGRAIRTFVMHIRLIRSGLAAWKFCGSDQDCCTGPP